jgi:hypothetical protein
MVQKFFWLPCKREKKIEQFLPASLKTLEYLMIVKKAAAEFLFQLHWGFLHCTRYMSWLTFRVTGGYLKAGKSFLKMVTGMIFKIS